MLIVLIRAKDALIPILVPKYGVIIAGLVTVVPPILLLAVCCTVVVNGYVGDGAVFKVAKSLQE